MRQRMSQKAEREAWTAFVEGREPAKANKYHIAPKAERGKYASKHEAEVAGKLATWKRIGAITDLREQVKFVLVEGQGKVRSVTYIADFVWKNMAGETIVGDAKGFRTPVYRIKKKLLKLLHGVEIEEL